MELFVNGSFIFPQLLRCALSATLGFQQCSLCNPNPQRPNAYVCLGLFCQVTSPTEHLAREKPDCQLETHQLAWVQRKLWDSQGCNEGGGRAEYPQSDESIQQSITFVCNVKAGKSPIWHAQQLTHFALLLGSISRKLLTSRMAFITSNSSVHPSPSAGDAPWKWVWSNPPPSMRMAVSLFKRPTHKEPR